MRVPPGDEAIDDAVQLHEATAAWSCRPQTTASGGPRPWPASRRPTWRPLEADAELDPRRMVALPAFTHSPDRVAGDVGAVLVDHPHHAQRNPHPLDAQAVGPHGPVDHLAHRIGQGRHLAQAVGHRRDPRLFSARRSSGSGEAVRSPRAGRRVSATRSRPPALARMPSAAKARPSTQGAEDAPPRWRDAALARRPSSSRVAPVSRPNTRRPWALWPALMRLRVSRSAPPGPSRWTTSLTGSSPSAPVRQPMTGGPRLVEADQALGKLPHRARRSPPCRRPRTPWPPRSPPPAAARSPVHSTGGARPRRNDQLTPTRRRRRRSRACVPAGAARAWARSACRRRPRRRITSPSTWVGGRRRSPW